MASNPNEPAFKINEEEDWESMDDLASDELSWLEDIPLAVLSGNRRANVDLAKLVDLCAVESERMKEDSQLSPSVSVRQPIVSGLNCS